ncbi:hypothetical protein Vau01_047170 [Virgisporangium aurantiacum]|uniref:Streptogrisin C n=2 Tax=Virgisporangium aurantiacum TaxID=175570 RepID=A0A8J3Z8K6_9ACTN|nr:hypothetical protein Vau01_047170 [Virgisporangium aurantiacum]
MSIIGVPMSARIRHALVAVGAVVLVATASPAAAAPGGPADGPDRAKRDAADAILAGLTDRSRALLKVQEDLDRLADDIRAAAPSRRDTGLGGLIVEAEHRALRLYWRGTVPAAVSARIARAGADGLTVTVEPSRYTEAELLAEVDRMSRQPLFRGARTGQRSMVLGPKPDGSGLSAEISGLPTGTAAVSARSAVPALDSAYALDVTESAPVAFTTRMYDPFPHWGGSVVLNRASGYRCSTAFAVTGNNGASTYLLSAAHCGEGTWGSWEYLDANNSIAQFVYGSTIAAGRRTDRDVQLIQTPEGSQGAIYWGAHINPPTGDPGAYIGASIGGDSSNNVGDRICLSGSYSGTICPSNADLIRIRRLNQTITYDPPSQGVGRVTNLADAEHALGQAINGNGDSGGPVVSVRSDGRLAARGIISGMRTGAYERPCVGYVPSGRTCSMNVFFADLRSAMSLVGVHINTT